MRTLVDFEQIAMSTFEAIFRILYRRRWIFIVTGMSAIGLNIATEAYAFYDVPVWLQDDLDRKAPFLMNRPKLRFGGTFDCANTPTYASPAQYNVVVYGVENQKMRKSLREPLEDTGDDALILRAVDAVMDTPLLCFDRMVSTLWYVGTMNWHAKKTMDRYRKKRVPEALDKWIPLYLPDEPDLGHWHVEYRSQTEVCLKRHFWRSYGCRLYISVTPEGTETHLPHAQQQVQKPSKQSNKAKVGVTAPPPLSATSNEDKTSRDVRQFYKIDDAIDKPLDLRVGFSFWPSEDGGNMVFSKIHHAFVQSVITPAAGRFFATDPVRLSAEGEGLSQMSS